MYTAILICCLVSQIFGEDLFNFNLDQVFSSDLSSTSSPIRRERKLTVESDRSPNKINDILKNYLIKLYTKKYESTNQDQESDQNQAQRPDDHNQDQKDDQVPMEEDEKSKSFLLKKNKTKNLLSLIQIVKFQNSECVASGSLGQYLGVCYHDSECQSKGGTAMGDCASGYGVCCVFIFTCGSTVCQNCTYFQSPDYPALDPPGSSVILPPPVTSPAPTPDPRWEYIAQPPRGRRHRRHRRQTSGGGGATTSLSCTIGVTKVDDDVEQMRIDFLDLELAGPTNGTCINERLVISGQNVNDVIPVLCGYNSGQHVYVDVSQLDGPLQISVLSNAPNPKRFKLRICQYRAPTCAQNNCLQYYTGVSGTISSFNYDQAAMFNRSQSGYLNNLNYAICIRKEEGYCSVTYSNMASGLEYPFQLPNVNNVGQSTVPPGQAGVAIFNCPNDYVAIGGGLRLCGDRFNDGSINPNFRQNAPVTDVSAGPIIVQVRTNNAVTGKGFKLFYMQNRC